MKRSNLILRSMLFVPGHNEKLLESAAKSKADAFMPDIEDSVLPISNKKIARNMIVKKVKEGLFSDKLVFPRINDIKTGFLLKDIQALTIEGVDGFVVPKILYIKDIQFVDKLLEAIEYEKGFKIGKFKIIPLIESAAAVINMQEICLSSERIIAVVFGSKDFVADVECLHDSEEKSLFTHRTLIVLASRATGVIPINAPHINVHDLEALEKNVKSARLIGFEGQALLHPKEIEILHKYYTPSEKEVAEAEEMLQLFEEAQKDNKGVAIINGKFIGPPLVITAKKILERDKLIRRKIK